jgi:hypothetical protein
VEVAMTKILWSAVATACLALVACGGEEAKEDTAQSSEKLDFDCLRNARTRADVDACLGNGGAAPEVPATPPAGGGGQSCRQSVQCVNGVCKCGNGVKNAGQVCDGATTCSTICRDCD